MKRFLFFTLLSIFITSVGYAVSYYWIHKPRIIEFENVIPKIKPNCELSL